MVRREGRLCGIDHIVSSFPDWSVGHGNGTCRNTCPVHVHVQLLAGLDGVQGQVCLPTL